MNVIREGRGEEAGLAVGERFSISIALNTRTVWGSNPRIGGNASMRLSEVCISDSRLRCDCRLFLLRFTGSYPYYCNLLITCC